MSEADIEHAKRLITSARRICALTGAGISAESGIPTFRGDGGLWRTFRAEELATPEAFTRDPHLVWEWYDWRRGIIAAAQPNAGHLALATLEQNAEQFALVTQNVDGLHARSGSQNIIAIHGDIWTLRCTRCSRAVRDDRVPLPSIPPHCECGALMRPGVVWFGEGLDARIWDNAQKAARSADLLLVIGTSAVVYPAASLAPLAKASGARIVEINVDDTALSPMVDVSLRGRSGDILPQLTA
jgi:NAD-dependent deacetylase